MITRPIAETGIQFMPIAARQASVGVPVRVRNGPEVQPFRSAADAWFWTMAALTARREGARYTANKGLVSRPCDPDDVVKCLDGLYRQRRIDLAHARILRIWGERQMAPSPSVAAERHDHRMWLEALERLEWPLRVKGIVT
ncbi:MAG: hypothetical protein QOG25_2019 [Acetobacteraceae bacterium]|jgi:hypothetical protein|nr:hypothetical protein [Acetobacteraceae bacterium]